MAMLWALTAMGTAMEHSSHITCTMHCVICDAHRARMPYAFGRIFVLVVCNATEHMIIVSHTATDVCNVISPISTVHADPKP